MAGCGSKKMAKGGMVSPRKAMAMGKKPKKFANGGLAAAGKILRPNMGPAQTQTQMRGLADAAARMQGSAAALEMARRQRVMAGTAPNPAYMAEVNNRANALKALYAGRAAPQAARPGFKKGGMVKKGKK